MSTIQASNISDGTDTVGTEYVINGSAKSWVNFDGTGTVSIRESFNVSSIADDGTGRYTINFTIAMPDANYVCSGMSRDINDNTNYAANLLFGRVSDTKTSGAVQVTMADNSGNPKDATEINIMVVR